MPHNIANKIEKKSIECRIITACFPYGLYEIPDNTTKQIPINVTQLTDKWEHLENSNNTYLVKNLDVFYNPHDKLEEKIEVHKTNDFGEITEIVLISPNYSTKKDAIKTVDFYEKQGWKLLDNYSEPFFEDKYEERNYYWTNQSLKENDKGPRSGGFSMFGGGASDDRRFLVFKREYSEEE